MPIDNAASAERAWQRPPAEILHAEELARLRAEDGDTPRPPGWQLSLSAARAFIAGDRALGIAPKIVAPVASIERMLVTLATGRVIELMLDPGIVVGAVDFHPDQALGEVKVGKRGRWGDLADAQSLATLDAISASELVRDLEGLRD